MHVYSRAVPSGKALWYIQKVQAFSRPYEVHRVVQNKSQLKVKIFKNDFNDAKERNFVYENVEKLDCQKNYNKTKTSLAKNF